MHLPTSAVVSVPYNISVGCVCLMSQSAPSPVTRPRGLRPDSQQHMPEEVSQDTWQGLFVHSLFPQSPNLCTSRKGSVHSQYLTGMFCRWLVTMACMCRFVLGEGIEKKTNDLAKEVEAQTKAMDEAAKKAAAPADSAASPSEAAAEPAQVAFHADSGVAANTRIVELSWPAAGICLEAVRGSQADKWHEQLYVLRRPCIYVYSPTGTKLLQRARIV